LLELYSGQSNYNPKTKAAFFHSFTVYSGFYCQRAKHYEWQCVICIAVLTRCKPPASYYDSIPHWNTILRILLLETGSYATPVTEVSESIGTTLRRHCSSHARAWQHYPSAAVPSPSSV